MLDTDDQLTPLEVGPQTIPAAPWQRFKQGGDDEALDRIRAQVENQNGASEQP